MAIEAEQLELIPDWSIELDGRALEPEVLPDVLSVEVEQHVNGPDTFEVAVNIWDTDVQDYKWIDDGTFAEGREIRITMGYGEDHTDLIVGEIVAAQADFGDTDSPVLRVQGYDKLHRLRRGRKTRTFADVKDSEAAELIAQDLQLSAQIEESEVVHAYLVQHNQSDIDFLAERARRIHFELDVVDGVLIFRPSAHADGKTVTLTYRRDLRKFEARLSTLAQVDKVSVRGWNPQAKEAIVGLATESDVTTDMGGNTLGAAITKEAFGESEMIVVDQVVFSQTEADQMARALLNEICMRFIEAEGETLGNPAIRAGEVVELDKLGTRFSGLYYVTRAQHIVDEEGYVTRFSCQRNAAS